MEIGGFIQVGRLIQVHEKYFAGVVILYCSTLASRKHLRQQQLCSKHSVDGAVVLMDPCNGKMIVGARFPFRCGRSIQVKMAKIDDHGSAKGRPRPLLLEVTV